MTATSLRARVVLAEARSLGVEIEDLVAVAGRTVPVPTLAEHIAAIEPTFTPRTAATYRPYWRLAVDLYGAHRLTDLGVADMHAVVEAAAERARRRRPDNPGHASRETCIAALRALYRRAVDSGAVSSNPAAALTKPRRPRPRRRALEHLELAEVIDAIRATSPDPALDLLLVRFHLESGARRSGALALRRRDLDERRATVWLTEKGGGREQPVSPSLLRDLIRHHAERHEPCDVESLFRRRDTSPITERDYDRLFTRARTVLPWAARTPVSAHVLRHTAITAIARLGGYPVAQAFAGHTPPTVTGRYLHATLAEVAEAVAVMTGDTHPLVAPGCPPRSRCQRGVRLTPG